MIPEHALEPGLAPKERRAMAPHRVGEIPAGIAMRLMTTYRGVATAGALAQLQRAVGNAAVQQAMSVQRCGPVPCDCSPEERAAKEGPGPSGVEDVDSMTSVPAATPAG